MMNILVESVRRLVDRVLRSSLPSVLVHHMFQEMRDLVLVSHVMKFQPETKPLRPDVSTS